MRSLGLLLPTCLLALAAYGAPLKVCMVSGSFEYDSDKALGIFKDAFEARYEAECTLLSANGWEDMPGLEALDTCDAALFYTRRLKLPEDQMALIKRYCEQGKPVVGVRTASHGFQPWLEMDKTVFGGDYQNHYKEGPSIDARLVESAKDHPILDGIAPFRSRYSLYKNPNPAEDVQVLLKGFTPEHCEPIAWTRERNGQRVFYTSLGGVEDFENAMFQRLVANALFWAANREPARMPLPDPMPRPKPEGMLKLVLRGREEDPPGSGRWKETSLEREIPAAQAAILICDMWDQHWCTAATQRCDVLAKKMAGVIEAAHKAGLLVIHAPSETLAFYDEWPQRRRAQSAPECPIPTPKEIAEPPLPIDDSDGGCDTPGDKFYIAWRHQHPAIPIGESDVISEDGQEIYRYLQQEGIETLIVMGVHTNMCVLGRSFGIRQMTKWGKQCYLVRDLTDTMYNPAMPPKVSHDEGTELVVEHIEKYWCPSMLSEDLVNGLPKP